nr:flagellar biogenesis protein FliO [Mucilaginibacter sp. X5P1]
MTGNTLYVIYNLIWQLFSFWLLVYLNAYINGAYSRFSAIILLLEAGLLVLIIWFLNKLSLSESKQANKTKILKITTAVSVILTLVPVLIFFIVTLFQ